MRVLITGINGLVGKDIAELFAANDYDVVGVGRSANCVVDVNYYSLDLTEQDRVESLIKEVNPEITIHCAAYTRLDDCETNKDYAYSMNVDVTDFLAGHSKRFVYVSSDAVFSGNDGGGYSEESIAEPINYYGLTKLEGEKKAKNNANSLIVRSSLYGYRPDNESAIAEWGLRSILNGTEITGFSDVIFNPMYSKQFADAIKVLIEKGCLGTYHLGCDECISKYEFFCRIAEIAGKNSELVKCGNMSGKVFKAQRTKNTSLDVSKFTSEIKKKYSLNEGLSAFVKDVREKKGF
ncbi:SDR family oxidoreductase [Butyrivibrio sp. WCD2001]|uniref:SDR family oxidoreductase n=1 Tax=Butyrivibrio sp. WCD2001 TaxID=1280681 RepID=UPI0004234B81|nr:SDR family oxidoreductase [Butyrivibrio sp. WCD2001]